MEANSRILAIPQVVCTQCAAWARAGSKYCSDACGIAAQEHQVRQEKAEQVLKWKKDRFVRRCAVVWQELLESKATGAYLSSIEAEDFKTLAEVEQEQLSVISTLERIQKQQSELELEIQMYQVPVEENGSDSVEIQSDKVGKTSHFDCPYCGVVPSGNFAALSQHLPQCFHKFETLNAVVGPYPTPAGDVTSLIYCDHFDPKTNKYCKKLKASCAMHSGVFNAKLPGQRAKSMNETKELCGAPTARENVTSSTMPHHSEGFMDTDTANDSDGTPFARCRILKRECTRHYNWENLARRQLELQLISHRQLSEALKQEMAAIKEKMILARLSRGLKGNAVTIPEHPQGYESSSMMDISTHT